MRCQKRITKNGRVAIESVKLQQQISEVMYVKCYENKVVNMISVFAKVQPMTTVSRLDFKSKVIREVKCSHTVKGYNKSMRTVDLADQFYFTLQDKSKRHHLRLIFYRMVVVTTSSLYRGDVSNIKLPKEDISPSAAFKLFAYFRTLEISAQKREENLFQQERVKQTSKERLPSFFC